MQVNRFASLVPAQAQAVSQPARPMAAQMPATLFASSDRSHLALTRKNASEDVDTVKGGSRRVQALAVLGVAAAVLLGSFAPRANRGLCRAENGDLGTVGGATCLVREAVKDIGDAVPVPSQVFGDSEGYGTPAQ